MAEAWHFRRGTMDQLIFNDVFAFNEYQLPSRFAPGDIVIDGGAHIGSFAHAVVMRGGENVYSIEPDPANYAIAAEHLRPLIDKGFVRLLQRALWRSDPNDDELRFDGYHPFPKSYSGMEGIINTGNGSVIWGVGEPVPKIALDELVDAITNHGEKRVRLLKLDCEGAEWPIVLTSRRLHLLDEICGEFHEIGGQFPEISEDRPSKQPIFCAGRAKYTIDELVRVLNEAGFAVTYRRHTRPTGALEGLGLFFAKRAQAA
jgi:FkbM family methyltransferase